MLLFCEMHGHKFYGMPISTEKQRRHMIKVGIRTIQKSCCEINQIDRYIF